VKLRRENRGPLLPVVQQGVNRKLLARALGVGAVDIISVSRSFVDGSCDISFIIHKDEAQAVTRYLSDPKE
jgi:hypothetical protein